MSMINTGNALATDVNSLNSLKNQANARFASTSREYPTCG